MPENEQSQQIAPKAPFQNTAQQRVQDHSSEEMPGAPGWCWRQAEDRRGKAGSWDGGGGVVTGGGATEVTHRWETLHWGLTWCSDAHVLLAVHHETSHRLPVGVIGCSLTYWKSAEHCFLETAKRVTSSHGVKTQHPPPRDCAWWLSMPALKRGKNISCFNLVAGLTSLLSFGLISSCEFGNEVSDTKSRDTRSPGSSCCHRWRQCKDLYRSRILWLE